MSTDDVSETTPAIPVSVKSLETFVCKVYARKSSARILSELRWELFRATNLESEMLPPIVGTLIPHVQQVNYKNMVMRDRGYASPHPSLPNLEGNGSSSHLVKTISNRLGTPETTAIDPKLVKSVQEITKHVSPFEGSGHL